MRALLSRVRPRGAHEIVKKMDSTLRGNFGPELRALLEALPRAFAIVCPAYPKNGRSARDGVLFVHGTPVDRTDFGRDLFSPVRDARIAAHLPFDAALFAVDLVRGGKANLIAAIDGARSRGLRVAVVDAERDDDLSRIAEIGKGRDDVLWVGSAGLIEMLHRPARGDAPPVPVPAAAGPVVYLIGSISAMSQYQIDDFARDPRVHAERLDPVALIDDDPAIARAVGRCARGFAAGQDILIAVAGSRPEVEAALARGAQRGWDPLATSRVLRESLAATVDLLVQNGGTVVLSGGDVARAFCERRGVSGMTLLAETAPGIPIARAIGADLFLVTKAGGFGEPRTYRRILDALHSEVTA
jgi:uncharacterized protein YgbK (DUF1537 family)